ncbi:DUF4870 domain-containing protein [Flavobacterium sp. SUN052]|uniref:DUF4870 domain-containing protein n=1 Tax=Flavobacterium sp. SUN052 TaxID=3002441 RepID=UPI00237E92FC|nr:DUF4870 domain-containing protein [Flavobacterium sp. SUN052]MEC4003966.1 DUF4870 domain-containing protein [Flavobacterium sp. SUN052]
MITSNEKTISAVTHLSTLSQYCIPFGNFILPIVIWSSKKKDSEFIDYNGKQTLNFQLSIFLYTVVLGIIAIPIIIYTVMKNATVEHGLFDNNFSDHDFVFENIRRGDFTGIAILAILAIVFFGFLKIMEFILVIYAAVKASNGEQYKYPLSIPFFK